MRQFVALCLIALLPCSAHAGRSLYMSYARMTQIDSPDTDYITHFPIKSAPPKPGSTIMYVNYEWRYENPPINLKVELCQVRGRCIDATKSPVRMAIDFSGSNPAKTFYFKARVVGAKNFKRVLGYPVELNVNTYEP